MKLAVDAGDLYRGDTWPSFASPAAGAAAEVTEWVGRVSRFLAFRSTIPRPTASPEDKVEAFKRTALCSGFEEGASFEAEWDTLKDNDLRIGFWGADWPALPLAPELGPFCSAGELAAVGFTVGPWASMLTERKRTICKREGVTIGRLASSFGIELLLVRETGSFLRSGRVLLVGFLRLGWVWRLEGKGAADGVGLLGFVWELDTSPVVDSFGAGGGSALGAGSDEVSGTPCSWVFEDTIVEKEGEKVSPWPFSSTNAALWLVGTFEMEGVAGASVEAVPTAMGCGSGLDSDEK